MATLTPLAKSSGLEWVPLLGTRELQSSPTLRSLPTLVDSALWLPGGPAAWTALS